jgi:hypothetical protein
MTATAQQPASRAQIELAITRQTLKDPAFRAALLTDPKAALQTASGVPFPEGTRIFVHEEDANTLHLAIPQVPANIEELSDEDLEKVAGGMTPLLLCAGLCGAGVCAFGIWVGRNM